MKENKEKEYEINKLWLNAQGNIKAFQMARFFFYLLFILSYKPIYLFLLNPINFFCLLYNGNVEEFEEKKCELLDTYEMPSVARTNVENKGSLKMAQIVIDCSMSQ